jgi:hypothetical protein
MIPVLAVHDPAAARQALAGVFGFTGDGTIMTLGRQSIALASPSERPSGFISLRLDHVALSVPDTDAACRDFLSRGAKLSAPFTPEGPREIPEFWESGVRFVFFDGPEGWPLEFCALRNCSAEYPSVGHSHYGIRRPDFELSLGELSHLGATLIARHKLAGSGAPVNVAFLQFQSTILEVFDEPSFNPHSETGWIGLIGQ